MIKFSLARLDREPIELEGVEPPEFLGLEPDDPLTSCGPVSYRLGVDKVSGGALIRGECRGEVSGICGRCLEPVVRKVEAPDIELFLELDGSGDEVDISEDIREELAAELPMNLLCSDDCRGLCPVCGANRNRQSCNCSAPESGSGAWSALDNLKL